MRTAWVLLAAALAVLALARTPAFAQPAADPTEAARLAMVRDIERNVRETAPMTGIERIDRRVLDAFAKVPRHRFVPPQLEPYAYADTPLPLGFGQNLSQPFLAALMTHVLDLKPGERVFETGTDTGYQAAILAELGLEVFSMEIVDQLHRVARRLLPETGYGKVTLAAGDGYYGWEAHAPYDAMLIKESAQDLPGALLRQLRPGGRMVIPLGPADGPQKLTLVTRREDGRIERKALMEVRFTPFQGGSRI